MSKNNNLEFFENNQEPSKPHKRTKGKTWEEIYGPEYAAIKRQRSKDATKNRVNTTKGKKWEDIYTPEEVARRRERMKNNNPYHTLTEDQKSSRNKKCSETLIERAKTEPNSMLGRNHTEETKNKMREIKQELFSSPEYREENKKRFKDRSDAYFRDNHVVIHCKMCNKEMKLLPGHYHYKKDKYKTFCGKACQTEYMLTHDHFKYRANGWELYINSLNISELTFTGDHSFWITLKHDDGKIFHKNPDFIVKPFSETKKVVEVWGKRWHTAKEMEYIKIKYAELGIDCLLLTNIDFTVKNKRNIRNKIERWLTNVQ